MDFFDDDSDGAPAPSNEIDSDALIHWVHTTVLPIYEVPLAQVTWCPVWWIHPTAVYVFEVLRRAWEEAVVDDSGSAMSSWTIYHMRPHMDWLLSATGPFAKCRYTQRHGFRSDEHDPPIGLPTMEPTDLASGTGTSE